MSTDRHDLSTVLLVGTAHARQQGDDHGPGLQPVRASVGPEGPVAEPGAGRSPAGLPEVQEPVLEHGADLPQARGQEEGPQEVGQVARRRDDHLRVTCRHCGARVLTRNSGAMWKHSAAGAECPGSDV
jgi:hypothetical protein